MFQFPAFTSLAGSNGLSHSEILGSKLIRQFPETYRSLSRPSSPLEAKASSVRSYLLYYNLISQ